jgi:selenocysteine lyase/cysteine desulfurase
VKFNLNWNRAATCADPAPGVAEAMLEGLHALPGDRGTDGETTAQRFFAVRALAAKMFGITAPERVIFTPGATYGLNVAIHCGVPDNCKVLTTKFEHNSMLRPLAAAQSRGVSFKTADSLPSGQLNLQALEQELASGEYSVLAMSIASNTLGVIQPVKQACALARSFGVSIILDLAQGGGVMEVDLDQLGVAYASIAGHKSLHAPRGVGMLFVGSEQQPKSFLFGGTGTFSSRLEMPEAMPAHLEAGTSNFPGIYGLGAALSWLQDNPPELNHIRAKLQNLERWCRQLDGLQVLPQEELDWEQRLPILALRHETIPAELIAEYMATIGVQVRAGSMCAALALPALQIQDSMLRLSPPFEASDEDFLAVQQSLEEAIQALA